MGDTFDNLAHLSRSSAHCCKFKLCTQYAIGFCTELLPTIQSASRTLKPFTAEDEFH